MNKESKYLVIVILKKELNFLVDNVHDRLSCNDIEKVLSIFEEIDKILPEIIDFRNWWLNMDIFSLRYFIY